MLFPWVKQMVENEVKHFQDRSISADYAANSFAIDTFRKMGYDERKEAMIALETAWPEAHSIIASNFPHLAQSL